jgi:orotidine-5'-phosphate decarboxylase
MSTASEALAMARRIRGLVPTVKVGSVLFTAVGPTILARLRALRFRVMLDLKFFDIPNTVEQSVRSAVHHRVAMLTVHASGAGAMLRAAVLGARTEARRLGVPRPLVLGVTVLTSTADGGPSRVTAEVLRLARAAQQAGCDGVVASAHEAAVLRRYLGQRMCIVCPGIRPRGGRQDDQRRVATPGAAVRAGADFLVVGRPITASRNPRKAIQILLEEMEAVNAC